ncbi:MAG: hypothetical protein HFACDABA_00031 [Anaerolineales bacterium]|nr:hypothetical protein [Anaerolineales bacterium]
MDFNLHTNFESLAPLADAWNNLLARAVTDVPFLHFEYLRNWWHTRGGGEWPQADLRVVTTHAGRELIGVAPLFQTTNRDGLPALMLLGSIEISDYLDLIVRPEDIQRVTSGLFDFLDSSETACWRALDFYNLPEASATLAALESESAARGWTFTREVYQPAPFIPLPADFDAYLASIDKKQRHEIRRKMRRATERDNPARFQIVEHPAALDAEMEAFFNLMTQDPAKETFLTEAMRAQMLATARTAMSQGWLWLAFLEVDGQKAAGMFNFDYGNRLWGYNSGVNRDFIELSPGWVLLGHVLQWACEHGRLEFDFMRGSEEYKYRFGAQDRMVMRAKIIR